MRIGPLGVWEILIILVVILLVFGPRRLPEMAKGIGQSVREFRKGIRDLKDDISKDDEPKKVAVVETPAAPPAQPTVHTAAAHTATSPGTLNPTVQNVSAHADAGQTHPVQSEPVPEVRREADEVKSA